MFKYKIRIESLWKERYKAVNKFIDDIKNVIIRGLDNYKSK